MQDVKRMKRQVSTRGKKFANHTSGKTHAEYVKNSQNSILRKQLNKKWAEDVNDTLPKKVYGN